MEAYAAPSPSAKPRYRLLLVDGRWTCIPLPLGPLPAPAKPKRSPVSKACGRTSAGPLSGAGNDTGQLRRRRERKQPRPPPTEPDPFKVVEFELVLGIADARLRVRRQAKAFIREETNRSVLNRESFGERKGTRAGRKGQRNF